MTMLGVESEIYWVSFICSRKYSALLHSATQVKNFYKKVLKNQPRTKIKLYYEARLGALNFIMTLN